MAIIDLPTTGAFRGAQFSLGLDVSESTYTGFLTGNRTRRSNLADRLRGTLTLPPCVDALQAAAREALLMGMRSNGDWLRLAMPHRKFPNGTLRGSPVLSASAAAGARAISISGALSGANLLTNSGFEIDSNADGVADQYSIYYDVLPANLSKGSVGGNGSPNAQRYSGDIGAGHQLGVIRTQAGIVAGQAYSYTVDTNSNTLGLTPVLYIGWYTAGSVFISDATAVCTPDTGWVRQTLSATAPATAAIALLYVWHANTSGTIIFGASGYVDNMQFQAGAATPYAGLPTLAGGDWLAVGGNLLQVGYAGATGTDAGALASVPLSMPLPKALSAGAAVTWAAPTGVWELDDDGLQLDYTAGVVQGGVAIPLRQVVQ